MLSSVPRLNPPSLTTFSEVIFLTYPHWIDFSFSMSPWPWRWIISAHQKLMVQLGMDWNYQIDIPSHERRCHGKPQKQGEESVILTHTPYIGRQRPNHWTTKGVSLFQYSADAIKFYTYHHVNTLENHCWYHCVLFFPKHLWLSEINKFVYWFFSSPFARI